MVREGGLEPPSLAALEPKSSASANSAIPAGSKAAFNMLGGGGNSSLAASAGGWGLWLPGRDTGFHPLFGRLPGADGGRGG